MDCTTRWITCTYLAYLTKAFLLVVTYCIQTKTGAPCYYSGRVWRPSVPSAYSPRLTTGQHTVQRLVGWEINVPFPRENRLYRGQSFEWRFTSVRLRMANDTVTSRPRCLFVQRRLTIGKDTGSSFEILR